MCYWSDSCWKWASAYLYIYSRSLVERMRCWTAAVFSLWFCVGLLYGTSYLIKSCSLLRSYTRSAYQCTGRSTRGIRPHEKVDRLLVRASWQTSFVCQSVWIISYFSVCGAETESFVRPSAHLPAAEWNLHLYASSSGQHPLPSKSSQWLWGVSLHSCFTSAACCFQKDEDKLWGRKRMWWQVISKQA